MSHKLLRRPFVPSIGPIGEVDSFRQIVDGPPNLAKRERRRINKIRRRYHKKHGRQ